MTTVTDIDGNVYTTVIIGTQEWMVENLKTTKFNDGTPIPNVTGSSEWNGLVTPGYCWYNNNIGYKSPYGALYNIYAVLTGKLAPSSEYGWRVPTRKDWQTLVTYLGGTTVARGKLKEAGTAHWASPNYDANNSSKFTALPGGYRYSNWAFGNLGYYGYMWSSTYISPQEGGLYQAVMLSFNNTTILMTNASHLHGFSVRCIRDAGVKKPKYWFVKKTPSEISDSILEINKQRLQMLDI